MRLKENAYYQMNKELIKLDIMEYKGLQDWQIDNIKKIKRILLIEFLVIFVVFLVMGILKLTIWSTSQTRRLIFNIVTTLGSCYIIFDFLWTILSKERRKKKSILDKSLNLIVGLYMLTYDILCFINVISLEVNGYFVGGGFLFISLNYLFQGIYHYFYPLKEVIEMALEDDRELKFTNALIDERFKDEVKELYESSFPDDEKAPFEILLKIAKEEKGKLLNVVLDDKLVGLCYYIAHNDIIFLFYLAVKKEYRNQGYGSAILSFFTSNHKDKRIILNIETLDEKAANYEERLSRKAFYEKNGFVDLNYTVREYYVDYEMLSYQGKEVNKEEYIALMSMAIGNERYKEISSL